jgi:hypothetical protein
VEETEAVASAITARMGEAFPCMTEMVNGHVLKPGYAYSKEFTYGLDLILDSLEDELTNSTSGKAA